MKSIIMIAFLFSLVSCGKEIRNMIGADYGAEIDRMNDTINEHNKRLTTLENEVDVLVSDLNLLNDSLTDFNTALNNTILSLQANLQSQINDSVVEITNLKLNESIVEFIDPCGDGVGYDEIILRTSSGKLIAYFESGSKRFLTILTDGTYQTTDNQACLFSITNGEVSWH